MKRNRRKIVGLQAKIFHVEKRWSKTKLKIENEMIMKMKMIAIQVKKIINRKLKNQKK